MRRTKLNRFEVAWGIFILLLSGCATEVPVDSKPVSTSKTSENENAASESSTAATPNVDTEQEEKNVVDQITLGAGCFWCIEAVLDRIDGIESVTSGYMGGSVKNPTYEQICTGRTGHAEVVLVEYDSAKLPTDKLLDVFWQLHDPTQLNRQGADVGTQYRSAIFYHSDEQKAIAEESLKKWDESKKFPSPIVTEISKASEFYKAEEYHQEFFARNPENGYCRYNILPKFQKLGLLRETDK